MEAAATAWFASMLQSKHSFERPTFFLGLGGQPAANIEGGAAMERTPGTVQVLPMGVAGFVQPGDFAAYRIKVGCTAMPAGHHQPALLSCQLRACVCEWWQAGTQIGHCASLTSKCWHIAFEKLASFSMDASGVGTSL